MSLIKQISRKLVYPMVFRSRGYSVLALGNKNRMVIVIYHSIAQKPRHQISVGAMDVKEFERHLLFFGKNFEVISLRQMFDRYQQEYSAKKIALAITFDDGYENNYLLAYPLLRKYNMCATMFVLSDVIDSPGKLTWYDFVDIAKHKINYEALQLADSKGRLITNLEELRTYFKVEDERMRQIANDAILKQVNVYKEPAYAHVELWRMMNVDQVRELDKSGIVEIGSHTATHPNLGWINNDRIRKELQESKAKLEDTIQAEVHSIAFPDGSYNEEVKALSLEAGYKRLLAGAYQCESDAGDKTILPRYCFSNTTTYEANMMLLYKNMHWAGF